MSLPSLLDDPLLRHVPVHQGFKVLPPVVLLERLGEGAFGSVYRGHHLNLHIEVAVKCLKSELVLQKPEYVDRFEREARIAASCTQENLVRVYDTLQAAGLYYTVMEFVDGETVEGRVKRLHGPMSGPESLTVFVASLKALRALHAKQVFHRDVKPPNILISRHGNVKLADLGIAKSGEQIDTLQTAAGTVMGTPRYMAPEQFEQTDLVGAKTDLYSLGATLGYMLVGRHVIQGEGLHEILNNVCLHGFPDIGPLGKEIPPRLCELVRDCTALQIKDRPEGDELLRRSLKLLHELGGEAVLADAEAGQSYGSNAIPTQLDRSRLKDIRRAMTTMPATGETAASLGADSLALTSFETTPNRQSAALTVPPSTHGFATQHPVAQSEAHIPAGSHSAAATHHVTPPAAPLSAVRRRRRWPWVMLLLFLLITAVGAAIVMQEPKLRSQFAKFIPALAERDPAQDPTPTTTTNDAPPATNPETVDQTDTTTPPPVARANQRDADTNANLPRPRVKILPVEPTQNEGQNESTVQFQLVLDRPATQPVTVLWGTVDEPPANPSMPWAKANVDYKPISSRPVHFGVGEDTARVYVSVLGNDRDDPDRMLAVAIKSAENADIATGGDKAAMIIVDDDEPIVEMTADLLAQQVRDDAAAGDWNAVVDKLFELLDDVPGQMSRDAYTDVANETLTAFRDAWPGRAARKQKFPGIADSLVSIADTGGSSTAGLLWIEASLEYDENDIALLGLVDPRSDATFRKALYLGLKATESDDPPPAVYRYIGDIYLMYPPLKDADQAAAAYNQGAVSGDSESAARPGRLLLTGSKPIEDVIAAIDQLLAAADTMEPPSGFAAYWYAAALDGNAGLAAAVADRYEGQTLEAYLKSYYIKAARLGYIPAQKLCEQRSYVWQNE